MNNNYSCDNIGNNVVLFGALVAITLAKDLTLTEQDILGNLLQVIAQNLLSMLAIAGDCQELYESQNNNTNDHIANNSNNTCSSF